MKIVSLVMSVFFAVLSTAAFIVVLSTAGLLIVLSVAAAADLPRWEAPSPVRAAPMAAAPAFGLAVSTLATPSFAQRAEDHTSGRREKGLRECNVQAGKMSQHIWGAHQIQNYRSCMMQHDPQE